MKIFNNVGNALGVKSAPNPPPLQALEQYGSTME